MNRNRAEAPPEEKGREGFHVQHVDHCCLSRRKVKINKNSKYCAHVNCLLLIACLAIMSSHPHSVADRVT